MLIKIITITTTLRYYYWHWVLLFSP